MTNASQGFEGPAILLSRRSRRQALVAGLWLCVAACAVSIASVANAGETPIATVEGLNAAMVAAMTAPDAKDANARYRHLEPAIEQAFDLETMIRVAGGQAWRDAGPEERETLFQAFAKYSTANYAARFARPGGQSFEIKGERPGPRETTLVDTQLIPPDGKAVAITYVLRQRDGDWRIVDVLLDGTISQLALQRSEFSAVSRKGAAKLADALSAQADQILKKANEKS